jgi:hypothetical protein
MPIIIGGTGHASFQFDPSDGSGLIACFAGTGLAVARTGIASLRDMSPAQPGTGTIVSR